MRAAQGIIWYTVLTWTNYVYKKETPPLVATGINSDAFLSLSLLPTLLSSYIFSLIFFLPWLLLWMMSSSPRVDDLLPCCFHSAPKLWKKISFFFPPSQSDKTDVFPSCLPSFLLAIAKRKNRKKKDYGDRFCRRKYNISGVTNDQDITSDHCQSFVICWLFHLHTQEQKVYALMDR